MGIEDGIEFTPINATDSYYKHKMFLDESMLWDYYAGCALAAVNSDIRYANYADAAGIAALVADAMLIEREKRKK